MRTKLRQILSNNLILERGLLIAPIVVMAYSLKNAVALSAAFAVITLLAVGFSVLLPNAVAYALRVFLTVLFAGAAFIPAALLVGMIDPSLPSVLGVYLPLLVTNSLVVQKAQSRFRRMRKPLLPLMLLLEITGFALVCCAIGLLREWIGLGTVWGVSCGSALAPAACLPFAGFFIIAFLGALMRVCMRKRGGWA